MAWRVVDVKLPFNQRRNTLGGPELGFPAVSSCPLFEQLDELLSILVIELRIRSLVPFIGRASEPLYSLFFQRSFPLGNGRRCYAVILSNLRLTLLAFEKLLSSGQPPLLFLFTRERDCR